MTSGWNATRKAMAGLLVAGAAAMVVPVPAAAQDDARLRRIESELRALQRAVFPGGDGRYFAPEVDTTTPQPQQTVGAPSTTPLTDVLARLDSLETQLARLTARSEENAHELRQLDRKSTRLNSSHVKISYAVFLALPSFPTRRSSDLAVFPGGDGRYFAPEVDTTTPQPQQTVGAPSTTPLTDVLARLDSLETQLARLTARSEENAHELRQ